MSGACAFTVLVFLCLVVVCRLTCSYPLFKFAVSHHMDKRSDRPAWPIGWYSYPSHLSIQDICTRNMRVWLWRTNCCWILVDDNGCFLSGGEQATKHWMQVLHRWNEEPVGEHWYRRSAPTRVFLADFGRKKVYGPYSRFSWGKCREASWGSYAKLRVIYGKVDWRHATETTS